MNRKQVGITMLLLMAILGIVIMPSATAKTEIATGARIVPVGTGLPISGVHALLALIVALAIANLFLIHLSRRREALGRKKNNESGM
jgi:Zn-dependent protease with chaperone function